MKNAFSFFELLVVLFLVGIVYGVFFSNFNFKLDKKNERLGLDNLKTHLLKNYQFEKSLTFVCIKGQDECYVFIDGKINKENKIDSFFEDIPTIYEYSTALKRLEFTSIKFDTLQSDKPFFEFRINQDGKNNEMIVDTSKGIYIFNAIEKPTFLENLSSIKDFFEKRIIEVKNAF